jgi:gliding motility-associated-like protein
LALKKPFLDLDDELTINPGQSAIISPIYQGLNPQSIIWTPLDQITCTSCLETEVNPLQSTQYNIEIRVNELCTIRDSTLVLVRLDGLYLPSAFSPNQDGTNDSFRPLNNNIESYSMSIYNRWGELIYKSDDHTIGWDGTYRGRDAGLGVYTYVAEYSFINQSEKEIQSGNVTLIR